MTCSRATAFVLAGFLLIPAMAAPAASRSVREQVDGIEVDLRDLQQKVVEMQEVQTAIQKSIADLRDALALDSPGRRSPADLAARLDSVETDLRVVQENQNDMRLRVSVLSDKLDGVYRKQAQMAEAQALAAQPPVDPLAPPAAATPVIPPPSVDEEQVGDRAPATSTVIRPTPPPVDVSVDEPLVDPEELYQAARADFGRGSYDLALSGFEEFLQRFPESDLADNAQYWVGECQYSSGHLEQAVAAFERVVTDHPESDKAPDSAYKKGLALLELQRTAEGIIQLQLVKDTWPGTPAGRLARTKLQAMGLL